VLLPVGLGTVVSSGRLRWRRRGEGGSDGSQSYWKASSQTHSRNSQAFSSPSCGFHRTFGLGMWRERDSSASILVAHSNGQMIRAPWRPSGSRSLMMRSCRGCSMGCSRVLRVASGDTLGARVRRGYARCL
jgi:hypothetical protein